MKAHLAYLRYVLRHKWFVFKACLRLGVPPHQAVLHDWTKFLPSEWFPYAAYFYGKAPADDEVRQAYRLGFYLKSKDEIDTEFDRAWLFHQHRSPHHWQYWMLREDDGGVKALRMPDRYMREMVADWIGAGQALGKPDTRAWYEANKQNIFLHPVTLMQVEELLP